MDTWVEQTERRVAILLDQMAAALSIAQGSNLDLNRLRAQYQNKISQIYREEMPLARVMDSSDLVTRYEGNAVDDCTPSVQLVSGLFGDLQKYIKQLVKALSGLQVDQRPHWPEGVDLRLSGLAKGSLIVGVKLDAHRGIGSQIELDGTLDPLFIQVQKAMRTLTSVPQYVDANEINEDIRNEVKDPAVRDALLVAAYNLAPTGRKGIERVSFSNIEGDPHREALTPQSRKVLRSAIDRPTFETKRGDFEGVVREIDLDAKRFEIRGVEGVQTVRCIFNEMNAANASEWLNHKVVVRGQYEAGPSGIPRLMQVEQIIPSSEIVAIEDLFNKQTSDN
ncbi:hypothetical protein HQ393_05005 [Chitinibacter bivalviorum]|uniref:Uncharacterized protein n=1 Tax=Chitinibacter bivalviorum TaxID=2739434 RepID=A0A7H9BG26_9NEIS|nr:hypothetical protein [Chitinibacter bivalviorum]QLG87663.1 hypothetical protein HQ393_05005 [Chitinibacter bivalviorum]